MSGWIKLDKDLPESRRFTRFVKRWQVATYGNEDVTRYASDVSLLLGGVARLWMYADAHIASDNTLESTFAEIDEQVGIAGFSVCLPAEWLRAVDAERVELPDFLERNKTSAKERSGNAQRQARFRHRKKEGGVTRDVTPSNGGDDARPDQTRPDQTKIRGGGERPEGKGTDPAATPTVTASRDVPRETYLACKQAYPLSLSRGDHWLIAEREIAHRLEEGETPEYLIAQTEAYRVQQTAMGNLGRESVLRASNFYVRSGPYRGPFVVPPAPGKPEDPRKVAERAQLAAAEARDWANLKTRAELHKFRMPNDGESLGAYRTLLQRHEDEVRNRPQPSASQLIADLAGSKTIGSDA